MDKVIEDLAFCIENGKENRDAVYPPVMKGKDGATELAESALQQGIKPVQILEACMLGMDRVGEKFSRSEVFVAELLMAAKAMGAVMVILKPFFQSGEVQRKGVFVIGAQDV